MIEHRSMSFGMDGADLVGIAVPWNEWADIRENGVRFREKFVPDSLDVPGSATLRFGHQGGSVPLARVSAGTITFENDPGVGLRFRASLPESRADVREALERRDVEGVSIGFVTKRDSKRTPRPRTPYLYWRTVEEAVLDHLAIVEKPAYSGAIASLAR
tara:strand:- start:137 stop:613 length:477 start_codon:yes stop_codon:yes gene_type:complete